MPTHDPITEGQLSEAEFQAATQHLDALVQEFEALPLPDVQEKVFDLLQTVDAIHREGLNRLIGFLRAYGHADLVERATEDPIIGTLLLLYDLVPADELTQVETALEQVRPYIHSHGGEVEVLDVVNGVVHLRLSGACQGCAGSAMTLKRGVESALREHFAGFRSIEVHEPETISAVGQRSTGREVIPLVQAGQAAPRPIRRPVFKTVARVDDVSAGTMKAFDVDGVRILVANVEGEIYAVRTMCPGSMAPLDLGSFSPPILVCPWHNEAYDIRTGKRVDGEDSPRLTVLPIALADGSIQVAVNTVEAVSNLG